jgi:ATP-binding cassette subfamily C protein CydD
MDMPYGQDFSTNDWLFLSTRFAMTPPSPSSDKQSLRWLIDSARPARFWILLAVGLGFSGGLLLVAQAALIANILQGVFIDRLPRHLLLPLFCGLPAVVLLRAALAWAREVIGFTAGARIREDVRMSLMDHIAALGPAYTAGQRTGALASAVLEQVESLNDFFAHYLPQLALAVMIPAAVAAFVFPLSWAAGALLVLSAPMIPLFMVLVGMGAESIAQRNFQALARLSAHFLDVLQGLATLKLFDRSRAEAHSVARASAAYRRQTLRVLRVAFLSSAVLEFFSSMAIALVAVYLGLHYLGYFQFGDYGSPLDLAGGFFILLLAPDFYLPMRELGTHYHARAQAVGAAAEIRKILSVPAPPAAAGAAVTPDGFGAIHFRDVHFAFGAGRPPVLAGVDFRLAAGERVVLVGSSGAGKTTVLNLLMGFIRPGAGRIYLDDLPLEDVPTDHWRRRLAWIGQNPVLFHGTVAENIRIGKPDAGQDALEAAARAARVLDFCRRLPLGLDTPVGEQGTGLSKGQAQRVALARAYLKDAPLLLLDEPTAGLDADSERMALEALDDLCRNRTVLMVTHRLENIRRADRILVLDGGRIVEAGDYAGLIRRRGRFADMLGSGPGGES